MSVLSPRVFGFPGGIVSRIVSKRSSQDLSIPLWPNGRPGEIRGLWGPFHEDRFHDSPSDLPDTHRSLASPAPQ